MNYKSNIFSSISNQLCAVPFVALRFVIIPIWCHICCSSDVPTSLIELKFEWDITDLLRYNKEVVLSKYHF